MKVDQATINRYQRIVKLSYTELGKEATRHTVGVHPDAYGPTISGMLCNMLQWTLNRLESK